MKLLRLVILLLCASHSYGNDEKELVTRKNYSNKYAGITGIADQIRESIEVSPINNGEAAIKDESNDSRENQNNKAVENISNAAKALMVVAGLVVFYLLIIFPNSK